MRLTETAYAKINLALHVRKRREDGYHELETLFAFVDAGDLLTAEIADADSLSLSGEFASQLAVGESNIVTQALAGLPHGSGMALTLDKRLPVAAGLGGGSADAGAVFRLVERLHGLPPGWDVRASALGADVPACVRSVTSIGTGTGTALRQVRNDLAGTPVLLVNPRVPLATGAVFKAWDGVDRGALPDGPPSKITAEGRNDLEEPALRLCPPVSEVLGALRQTAAFLVRMSGSGATCFALFRSQGDLDQAAARITADWPEWWQMSGSLR